MPKQQFDFFRKVYVLIQSVYELCMYICYHSYVYGVIYYIQKMCHSIIIQHLDIFLVGKYNAKY